MATFNLREAFVYFVDGYRNTAAVNDATPAADDTSLDIDTLGTEENIPVGCRFTIVGSRRMYKVTATTSDGTNEVQTLSLGGATGGVFRLSFGGEMTYNLAYNATAAAIQAALEELTTIGPGNVAVAAASDFTITFQGDLAHKDVATMVLGDDLTGASGQGISTTTPGVAGKTTNITFTPALATTDGIPVDDAVINFLGRTKELELGEGNVTWEEKRAIDYRLNRGVLNTTRLGDEEPVDVSLDMDFQYVSGLPGEPSIPDILHRRGAAVDWDSAETADPCAPYSLDIEIQYRPACNTEGNDEWILLPAFRWTNLPYDGSEGRIAMTGACNVKTVSGTRKLFS